jgi:acetyltransferase-like isoleucine patch superfamily enzyme
MKQISALIVVKEREPGLLSISGDREKSLVPVFDGKKIIDFYLNLLHTGRMSRVMVLADREHTGMKDYLVFAYSTHKIRVFADLDPLRSAVNLLRPRKNECFLLLRADQLLVPDWDRALDSLLMLPPDNYQIVCTEKESVGFLLHDPRPLQTLRSPEQDTKRSESRIDGAWDALSRALSRSAKKFTLGSICMGVRTVTDYFNAHFDLLGRVVELIPLLPPQPSLDGEEAARITETGHVRNSYVASSTIVEGMVEHSILFSHVRVGKDARIINSIVMENNFIGNGALIQNAILCGGNEMLPRITPNIGEDVRIGEDDVRGANARFPDYLFGGISLIGRNVEIPKGVRISRNCYIGSNVGKPALKGFERVKAGETILQQ